MKSDKIIDIRADFYVELWFFYESIQAHKVIAQDSTSYNTRNRYQVWRENRVSPCNHSVITSRFPITMDTITLHFKFIFISIVLLPFPEEDVFSLSGICNFLFLFPCYCIPSSFFKEKKESQRYTTPELYHHQTLNSCF